MPRPPLCQMSSINVTCPLYATYPQLYHMSFIMPNILNYATCPLLYQISSIMPHVLFYTICPLLCHVLHYVKCNPLMSHVLYMPQILNYATCPLLCQMSSIMPHIFNYATRPLMTNVPKCAYNPQTSAITTWPNIILYVFCAYLRWTTELFHYSRLKITWWIFNKHPN